MKKGIGKEFQEILQIWFLLVVVGIIIYSINGRVVALETKVENLERLQRASSPQTSEQLPVPGIPSYDLSIQVRSLQQEQSNLQIKLRNWAGNRFSVETWSDGHADRYLYVGRIPDGKFAADYSDPRRPVDSVISHTIFPINSVGSSAEVIMFDSNRRVLDRFDIGPYLRSGDIAAAWYGESFPGGSLSPGGNEMPPGFYWNKTSGLVIGVWGIDGSTPPGARVVE